jgi:hypothetical protein
MLARRRLFQISLFDILLAMTAVIAMLVSYESLAPRAFIYTFGFVGGLFGTALEMNRNQPRLWHILYLAASFGIGGGYLAALVIDALCHGIPYESPWMWQSRRGRVPTIQYALPFGLLGGSVAGGLSTLLRVFKTWVQQQPMLGDNEERD